MDKNLRIGIIIGIAVISLSVFYYFVVRPIHNSNELGKCLERVEKQSGWNKQQGRDNCFKQF